MFGFLLGWNRKVRKLRKRWDRLRERALKKHNPLKSTVLKRLDIIENNIRTLEEQNLNRVVRARMAKETEISLEEINALLKSSNKEFEDFQKQSQNKN